MKGVIAWKNSKLKSSFISVKSNLYANAYLIWEPDPVEGFLKGISDLKIIKGL